MPRDYKNIKNNKSEPKIKNTSNLFSFLIGLVLGTFATSIYFNQNENIYEGKPSFNDNNYNKENENIETINTKEITFDFPTILEERTVEKIIEKTYPETQINIDKSEKITSYIIQVGSFKNFKSADALKAKLAFSGLSADIQKINMVKVLADKIEKLDEKIGQIGFVHPELKSITDMFTKRKENIQDNDPVQLAKDTKKCYQSLLEEGISLGRSLISVFKTLKSANDDVFHAAVSSINVEVPGR